MKALAIKIVGFSECAGTCTISPASIFHTVDGTLTLLLPALHIRLCGRHSYKNDWIRREIQPLTPDV